MIQYKIRSLLGSALQLEKQPECYAVAILKYSLEHLFNILFIQNQTTTALFYAILSLMKRMLDRIATSPFKGENKGSCPLSGM